MNKEPINQQENTGEQMHTPLERARESVRASERSGQDERVNSPLIENEFR